MFLRANSKSVVMKEVLLEVDRYREGSGSEELKKWRLKKKNLSSV